LIRVMSPTAMVHESLAVVKAEIALYRTAVGVSQNRLARRARVDPSVLSRALNGRVVAWPTLRRVLVYCRRNGRRSRS